MKLKNLQITWQRLLLGLCLAVGVGCQTTQQSTSAAETIPSDPSVHYGQLPNGFRYAIMRHNYPENRIATMLHVDAGSIMETDKEQGYAHFLEHAAFRRSKHFLNGDFFTQLERLGISYSHDSNACTSYQETNFHIDFPTQNVLAFHAAMGWYRDLCDGLLFNDDDINQERGVVLSEKRDHQNVDKRYWKFITHRLFPNLRLTQRLPMGKRKTLEQCTAAKLHNFHDRWYTPERLFFVAVGDLDVADMERQIQDTFGSLEPKPSTPRPDVGTILPQQTQFIHFSDRDVPETELCICIFYPTRALIPNRTSLRYNQTMAWVLDILNERLADRRHDTGIFLGNSCTHLWNFQRTKFDEVDISLTCPFEQWETCVPILEQEFRRLKQYGVTEQELERRKKQSILAAQQNVSAAETRPSRELVARVVAEYKVQWPFPSPQTELELAEYCARTVTVEDCQKVLQDLETNPAIVLISPQKSDTNLEARMQMLWERSQQTPIEPRDDQHLTDFAYHTPLPASLPPILSETHIEDLDVIQLTLGNGVRVNLKNTGLKDDDIRVIANIGQAYGTKAYPQLDSTTTNYLASNLIRGGLLKHPFKELHKIIEDQLVGIDCSATAGNLSFSGSCDKAHMLFLLELIAAYIQEPAFEERAWKDTQENARIAFDQRNSRFGTIYRDAYIQWISGNKELFGLPDPEQFFAQKRENIQALAMEILDSAPIELTVVGDLPPSIKEDIQRTFGMLPQRDEFSEAENVQLTFPNPSDTKIFEFDNDEARSVLAISFQTADECDFAENRRIAILADLFQHRVIEQIREKEGETYSPWVRNHPSKFKDYGRMEVLISIRPEAAEEIKTKILQIAEELKSTPVSKGELECVTLPIQAGIPRMLRSNSFWRDTLADCQRFPRNIEMLRTIKTYLLDITPEVIQETAKKYLVNPVSAVFQKKTEAKQN